jgi:hypothetical protein
VIGLEIEASGYMVWWTRWPACADRGLPGRWKAVHH